MNYLYFIRHGETIANSLNLVQGRQDYPLTKKGIETTLNTAKNIKIIKFDVVFSSPLLRALDTAKILNKQLNLNLNINIDDRLIERCFGVLEGKDFSIARPYFVNNKEDEVEGLENDETVYLRVKSFLDEINSKYDNKNILLVTHSNTILCLLKTLDSTISSTFRVPNSSLTLLEDDKNNNLKIIYIGKIF